jgi:hypothetical protein
VGLRYSLGILPTWLLCWGLPLPLLAQEETTSVADFFEEQPLILTVSRMSKPLLESPARVTVIDWQMIEASGVREPADLFRLVPGFVVGYHSGHAPVVTCHGLGQAFGRRMQVLIDGRSVFIPSFGGVPWSNLPLLIEDIQRVDTGSSLVDADSSIEDLENSSPEHTGFLAARYRYDERHEVSGAWYYVDEISWTDSAAVIPIARRLDLRYAYRLANHFSLELIGQNLLGEYQDYDSENRHQQLAYLRLSGSF